MSNQNLSLALLSAFSLLLIGAVGCDSAAAPLPASSKHTTELVAGTVELNVIFNSDRQDLSLRIPCSEGSTVLDILNLAQMMGDVEIAVTGEKEMAFVTSLAGVENLGSKGDNWVYKVNDMLGDKSCGEYSVKPGDRIQWSFGKYP